MNRRQTLSGLSPAQLNSRASAGPNRSVREPKSGKLTGRPSIAPNTASRRSSTFGKPSSNGVRQDPRPLSDKNYQQACIRTLIAYLSTHGYEHQIAPKVLASPTSKDFTNVVLFLFKQVDPNLVKNFGKIEDEVPVLFKRLRYPFSISKSALFAVGSPHTWPSLLAALTWVVELLNYQEKVEEVKYDVFDDKQKCDNDFVEYVATSYKHFLAGDDNQCQAVDEAKEQEFKQKADDIRNEVEQITQINEQLRSELDALRKEPSPLVAAQTKKGEHTYDREKFQQLIENLQNHKQTLEKKLVERQADLASKREQVAVAEKELDDLKSRVGSQTINRSDVLRMHNEKSKQEEILQSVSAQREALDRKVYEQEVQVEKRLDEMEAVVQEYHGIASRLHLIPATAKRADGIHYEIVLDRSAASTSDLLNIDLKGAVKPALLRLKESYATRARDLSVELLALQEKLDASQEVVQERAEENATLEVQVRKLDTTLKQLKETMEAEVRATAAQAERLQAEVNQLRSIAGHSIAESDMALRNLQQDYEEHQRRCDSEVKTLQGQLSIALEAILNHKVHIQNAVKDMAARVNQVDVEIRAAHAA